MLLSKNAQGIHDASVEKHGVISDTCLPVAGYIPMKNLVAELRQRRPWVVLQICTLPLCVPCC